MAIITAISVAVSTVAIATIVIATIASHGRRQGRLLLLGSLKVGAQPLPGIIAIVPTHSDKVVVLVQVLWFS